MIVYDPFLIENKRSIRCELGVKSDPILYRYSYDWLFKLMAEEGVRHLQLGTFFELYDLPDGFFRDLRGKAKDAGITISSVFTAHRELGGFFRDDGSGWHDVARRRFERLIDVAGILGATRVGSNPGAVLRDRSHTKSDGMQTYVRHFKELMHRAADVGVGWLTVEPMSCLAEPPTLPSEMIDLMAELDAHHSSYPESTARPGFCMDVAHGYADANRCVACGHFELLQPALPWTCEVHLKNTDASYDATFGFGDTDRVRGIIDVAALREFYQSHAKELPVRSLVGYLEIGGPKLGREYSDPQLDVMLRESLKYLRKTWVEAAKEASVEVDSVVTIAPSMMCVDPLNVESALRQVESLGVDLLHIDIMDGHFVPNMPMGLALVGALSKKTRLPIDVHLMVQNNDLFIDALAVIKVSRLSVHVESCAHLDRTLSRIREMGAEVGVALNPGTPLNTLDYILDRIDVVLLMTVNPGFAGQTMTPASIRKIADGRRYLNERGYGHVLIEVDGNVSFDNIPAMVAAGADCLVAGTSSIFQAGASWKMNLQQMRQVITTGRRGLIRQPREQLAVAGGT